MGIKFSADEIFEMAIEIEKNGAGFYRQAAENASGKETKQMLLDMAGMEDEHRRIFEGMREQLSAREAEQTVFDPDNEAALYLQAMADGRGWEGKVSPTTKLTGDEKIEDILRMAIEAEKNSVLFYVGLKDMVSAKAGKDKVEAIIREEMSHITLLSERLAELK